MRSMLRLWLGDLGADFAECADGAEALGCLSKFSARLGFDGLGNEAHRSGCLFAGAGF